MPIGVVEEVEGVVDGQPEPRAPRHEALMYLGRDAYLGDLVEDLGRDGEQPDERRPRARTEHHLKASLEREHLGIEARARDHIGQQVLDVVQDAGSATAFARWRISSLNRNFSSWSSMGATLASATRVSGDPTVLHTRADPQEGPVHTRSATTGDVDAIASCIALAFATDPVWEPALRRSDGRIDHHEPYWRRFVAAAVDQGTAFMTDGGEAVAIWVPPGGDELPPEGVEALDAFLEEHLDADAVRAMHTLYERFEASRAPLGPHYYLSLLATHPTIAARASARRSWRQPFGLG
jgi:hypothetical protein